MVHNVENIFPYRDTNRYKVFVDQDIRLVPGKTIVGCTTKSLRIFYHSGLCGCGQLA